MAELRDVFTAGGLPSYTYQDRKKFNLESGFLSALNRLKKFIVVSGPTKCGKTVLVRKLVSKSDSVWIEGGQVKAELDVWQSILMELGISSTLSTSATAGLEDRSSLEVNTSFKPGGIGAEAKGVEEKKNTSVTSRSETKTFVAVKAAIDGLLNVNKTLVIDDFHYLPPETQTAIIRGLKQAVFDGLRVVLLLIPHRLHQAVAAEIDVDGRSEAIVIPEWDDKELFSIAESGFAALNVKALATDIDALVKESFKSPHLMQDFCSRLCADNHVWRTAETLRAVSLPKNRSEFFKKYAMALSPKTFQALRHGPDRTDRKDRLLKDGSHCDIYEAVLLAIQRANAQTPLRWDDLRRELQALLNEDPPQQHEVTRVLEKMDEIAKERGGEPVIDYEKNDRELHLIDPFFRFFIKWNDLLRDEHLDTSQPSLFQNSQ